MRASSASITSSRLSLTPGSVHSADPPLARGRWSGTGSRTRRISPSPVERPDWRRLSTSASTCRNTRSTCSRAEPFRPLADRPTSTANRFRPCRAPSARKCGPRPTRTPRTTMAWIEFEQFDPPPYAGRWRPRVHLGAPCRLLVQAAQATAPRAQLPVVGLPRRGRQRHRTGSRPRISAHADLAAATPQQDRASHSPIAPDALVLLATPSL